MRSLCILWMLFFMQVTWAQRKAVFIILDGISADALEKTNTPFIDEIAAAGGYTRANTGGVKGSYNESPTISAPGYNHILTGTWSNKHNVWDNDIREPNYNYRNIFRIAEEHNPNLKTAIFSTWLDNRTKLIGDGLSQAGNIRIDYAFDGFELDEEKFPHDADKRYIFDIDEHVSKEAARYLLEHGPDLSWVYLEYTDDMGHRFGDSPEYTEAIQLADVQVGRIWRAIQQRMQQTGEEWMIVVTTDHGRDAATGKDHGGQSDRERTVWISTNLNKLNKRFGNGTASIDIMPSILRFMQIPLPEDLERELDGVPFIGRVSVANLRTQQEGKKIRLTWDVLDDSGDATILMSTTDYFRQGGVDVYKKIKKVKVADGTALVKSPQSSSGDYKFVLLVPFNSINNQFVDK
ncbi:MAG: alkaline phosphatase family protein [Cyclobacteriaceae bacterium]|nr:alkaline phosphatase family protein [Cyclobacteriaceae bacterium]